MGVNFGAGLMSPLLSLVLPAVVCAGNGAEAAGAAPGVADSSAITAEEKEDAVSTAFLCALLVLDFAGLFAKPAGISNKTSVSGAPTRKIDRIITSNLRHQT